MKVNHGLTGIVNYEPIIQYISNYLNENETSSTKNVIHYRFRKRSDHIKRVFMWAKRLSSYQKNINVEALLVAALFHDVGYAATTSGADHAYHSQLICENYLSENNYPQEFSEFVCFLVKNHSRKELMKTKDIPLELLLLMEADLLDETGALSILWDAMAVGNETDQSFEKACQRIKNFTHQASMCNPMITKEAKQIWDKKRNLVNEYLSQLEYDLGID